MAPLPLAIVTGGSQRLGKAFVTVLARNHYAVLLHYHNSESAAKATAGEIRALGVPVYLAQADLLDPEQVTALFSQVDEIPHPLRVLVNSAAAMRASDARTIALAEWDETLDLNLRAPFLCSREAAARMKEGGLIVNVTDIGARKTWTRFAAYTVSKAGLEALTAILARSLAPSIRVNAIAPGLVLRSSLLSDEEWRRLIDRLPMKRAATVEEVASALEFLLHNDYVTGQTLAVDGGYSLLG